MTLPQIRLVLDEMTRLDADTGLMHLQIAGAAGLATAQAKHDAAPYKRLARALEKHA